MTILLAFRHRKAVEPFVDAALALLGRGHRIVIGVHERDEKVRTLFPPAAAAADIEFVTLPDGRRDLWSEPVDLARHLRDLVQYLRPPYRGAAKLRRRVFERLMKRLDVPRAAAARWSGDDWLDLGEEAVARLERSLGVLESLAPPDPLSEQSLRQIAPDVVLVTPLVHFGSAQVELVKAARRAGVPVGMLLFSWDNLSTKGAMHVEPDGLFVWNERQRREAEELHHVAAERITVTGAPRFDRFFQLSSLVPRDEFCQSLGVPPDRAIVLYLCSSRLVAEKEIGFIRRWVGAVRHTESPRLREALLLVRPHPDLPLHEGKWLSEERTFRWAAPGLPEPRIRTLFGDPGALVLTSDYGAAQVLFESIFHSAAVVGLNTSAEIEAAIVGRPVFTVTTGDGCADGQTSTLHFHYLTTEERGFVRVAPTLEAHLAQLARELEAPTPPQAVQMQASAFIRPHGWTRSASEVLAEAVERVFASCSPVATADVQSGIAPAGPHHAGTGAPGIRKLGLAARELVKVDGAGIEMWWLAAGHDLVRMPPSLVEAASWLGGRLTTGAVLYDLAAGDGLLAVLAARRFGATVVAFEPNLAALGALWQNVLVNGCDGLVVPLLLRPGSRSQLGQERFDRFAADAGRLITRTAPWREHSAPPGHEVTQPVLSVPLEWAIRRWKLPLPDAVHARLAGSDDDLIDALESIVAESRLCSIVLTGAPVSLAAAAGRLSRAGFDACGPMPAGAAASCQAFSRAVAAGAAREAAARPARLQ